MSAEFLNNKLGIPNKEFDTIRDVFETLEEEWKFGLINVDDARVRMSKLYNQVEHKNAKAFVLKAYDGLEKVERILKR